MHIQVKCRPPEVAADVRRRNSIARRNPPRYVGGYDHVGARSILQFLTQCYLEVERLRVGVMLEANRRGDWHPCQKPRRGQ